MLARRIDLGLTSLVALPLLISAAAAQQPSAPTLPSLVVTPVTGIAAGGPPRGSIVPSSVQYSLKATTGTLKFSVSAPSWLTPNPRDGSVDQNEVTVTLTINSTAQSLPAGRYSAAIRFTNVTNGRGTTGRGATLAIVDRPADSGLPLSNEPLIGDRGRLLDNRGRPLIAR
jgi:hypothetical protein